MAPGDRARRARASAGQRLSLISTDLSRDARIGSRHVFNGFGCTGQNVSPALAWRNAPAGTKSFAISAYDPDAPTDSGWWGWGKG